MPTYTVNDLLVSLHTLANKYDYEKLLELWVTLREYLPEESKHCVLLRDQCCDTFPYLCDDGCQHLADEARNRQA